MDLRSGAISLGELAKNPKSRALVEREFPGILRHPLARKFMGLSLNQAVSMARGRVPQDSINRLLTELGEL